MVRTDQKELLGELIEIENKLRNGFGWDSFPKGVAKAYHSTLENKDASQNEIIQLFLRFLDKRVNVIISVYKNIIENGSKEKRLLEAKAEELEKQLQNLKQESNALLEQLSIKHKEEIATLSKEIAILSKEEKVTSKGSMIDNNSLENFVKIIKVTTAPQVLKSVLESLKGPKKG